MYHTCSTEALSRDGLGGMRRMVGVTPYPTSTSLPMPSCPSAPCPQHLSSWRVLREQVWLPPAESCVTTAVSSSYRTGTLRGGICPAASPTLRLLPYPSCPCEKSHPELGLRPPRALKALRKENPSTRTPWLRSTTGHAERKPKGAFYDLMDPEP